MDKLGAGLDKLGAGLDKLGAGLDTERLTDLRQDGLSQNCNGCIKTQLIQPMSEFSHCTSAINTLLGIKDLAMGATQ